MADGDQEGGEPYAALVAKSSLASSAPSSVRVAAAALFGEGRNLKTPAGNADKKQDSCASMMKHFAGRTTNS